MGTIGLIAEDMFVLAFQNTERLITPALYGEVIHWKPHAEYSPVCEDTPCYGTGPVESGGSVNESVGLVKRRPEMFGDGEKELTCLAMYVIPRAPLEHRCAQ